MAQPSQPANAFKAEKPLRQILLYGGFNLVLALALAALIYMTGNTVREIAALRSEIARLSLAIAQMAELSVVAQDAGVIMEELKHVLPDTEQLLFVSTRLEEQAVAADLGFGFQYGAVDEGPPAAILFTMSLTGQFVQIIQYIEAMRVNLPYIVEISSIESRVAEGGAHSAIVSGRLFIR